MMTPSPLPIMAVVLVLWGCASTGGQAPRPPLAEAEMVDARGNPVGTVRFLPIFDDGGQLRLEGTLEVPGISPGLHGFHIHETGVCQGPDFSSAGGHFNPYEAPHGPPDGSLDARHAGDLGNLNVAVDGTVQVDRVVRVAGEGDEPSIIVGRALILHAGGDDLRTQPDGDAGDRIACGVIQRWGSP
jgi:superoxide dismutase, Cu-Zn family